MSWLLEILLVDDFTLLYAMMNATDLDYTKVREIEMTRSNIGLHIRFSDLSTRYYSFYKAL
jgi:hypothetical protein